MMKFRLLSLVCLGLIWACLITPARAANITYYVSMTDGSDSNNGLSSTAPFQTINKINSLNLQPGDRVLFKCGDVWRGAMLMITRSGAAANPIVFGSYP